MSDWHAREPDYAGARTGCALVIGSMVVTALIVWSAYSYVFGVCQ